MTLTSLHLPYMGNRLKFIYFFNDVIKLLKTLTKYKICTKNGYSLVQETRYYQRINQGKRTKDMICNSYWEGRGWWGDD